MMPNLYLSTILIVSILSIGGTGDKINGMISEICIITILSLPKINYLTAVAAGLQCYTCARGGQDCSQVREETCSGSIYQDQFCLKVAADGKDDRYVSTHGLWCGRIINLLQMMSWSRSATTPPLTASITLPPPRAAETVSVYNSQFNVGCDISILKHQFHLQTWGSAGQRTSCLCDQNLCNGAAGREKGVAMAICVLASVLFCMWN